MNRRVLLVGAGGAAGIGALAVWWGWPRPQARLVLEEARGDVRVGRNGQDVGVATGVELGDEDALRTGADGSAVLAYGPETKIRVGAVSSLRVEDVSAAGLALELEDGALRATVRPGGAVRIGNGGRSIAASDAEVAVGVGADRLLYAEVTEGEVATTGFGDGRLVAGQRVVVRADGEALVGPIPEALLLEVAPVDAARTRAETARVAGQTEPGARVTVTGGATPIVAVAGPDGTFVVDVPLTEGENVLRASGRGVLGAEAAVTLASITRDTQVPIRATVEVGGPR